MDQDFHTYNEGRDEVAFNHSQHRAPGYSGRDPRRIHNYDETSNMQESVDTARWQESQRARDMRQEQFIRARHLKSGAHSDPNRPGFHRYNEDRDGRAFEQMQLRNPHNEVYDPRHIHNEDEDEFAQDSVDTYRWQESQRGRDMAQEQFMRARHLKHQAD
jgi:hypothetical protein